MHFYHPFIFQKSIKIDETQRKSSQSNPEDLLLALLYHGLMRFVALSFIILMELVVMLMAVAVVVQEKGKMKGKKE